MASFCLVCIFTLKVFKSIRISFISKVTRAEKAMIVANDTSLFGAILNFVPVNGLKFPIQYEQTTKFIPVTEPALLAGSYEEAPWRVLFMDYIIMAKSCGDRRKTCQSSFSSV